MGDKYSHTNHTVCIDCRACYHEIKKCSCCGLDTISASPYFKAPKKNNDNAWKIMSILAISNYPISEYYLFTLSEAKKLLANKRLLRNEQEIHKKELRRADRER